MPFEIRVDRVLELIEVVYPAHPTADEVADYVVAIRRAIESMKGPWDCLVDQRRLKVMPPELVAQVSGLNAWAERHRMRRSARVVASAVASLQANRMAREASLSAEVRSFTSRPEALAWLEQERTGTR
jgi:hypothetical protein